MTTSANVTVYVIYKNGVKVGEHSQHHYCKTRWFELLKFEPVDEHTIQWTWEDENEELHSKKPVPLKKFLKQFSPEEMIPWESEFFKSKLFNNSI
jgi:hypothetical protein